MTFQNEKRNMVIAGLVIGVIASLLVLFGNPVNMGFCIACFIRDTAGGLGLHTAAAVQYIRPEIIGLVLGIVFAVIMAVLGNLVVTPAWLGVPLDAVVAMIVPILIPFNLLKGLLNAILTLIVYKAISNLITPKKDQVKGR